MIRTSNITLLFTGLLIVLLSACGSDDTNNNDVTSTTEINISTVETNIPEPGIYDVNLFFPDQDMRDTLMANMITYIYKRPKVATNESRTQPQFREYYVDKITMFDHLYHYLSNDSTHYYYLIRPARSLKGTNRGVGGKFKTDSQLNLYEFEEVFNTYIMSVDSLKLVGMELFTNMINGSLTDNVENNKYIEWPDDRLKYDKEKMEWRYID